MKGMEGRGSARVVGIEVRDVFDEVVDENKRLKRDLNFANECINVLLKFRQYLRKYCVQRSDELTRIHTEYEAVLQKARDDRSEAQEVGLTVDEGVDRKKGKTKV